MIKINLKPINATAAAVEGTIITEDGGAGQEIQRKGLTHLLLILALPAILYIYGMQLRPERVGRMVSLQSQLDELQIFNQNQGAIVAEIKKIQEDEKSVQARIDAVSRVTLGRLLEIQVLDLVQSMVKERMWINKLQIDEGKFIIEGMSQNEIDVQLFQDDLTKNILLSGVSLIESSQEPYEGQNFTRFKIQARLERPSK